MKRSKYLIAVALIVYVAIYAGCRATHRLIHRRAWDNRGANHHLITAGMPPDDTQDPDRYWSWNRRIEVAFIPMIALESLYWKIMQPNYKPGT
jgi:hypothetical protein